MLLHSNIDKQDASQNTKAPFEFESTMTVANVVLPLDSFSSAQIRCIEGIQPPAHISRVSGTTDTVIVTIADTNDIVIGHCSYSAESLYALVKTSDGIPRGLLGISSDAFNILKNILKQTSFSINVDRNAFVFLPQCHVATMDGMCRIVRINDIPVSTVDIGKDPESSLVHLEEIHRGTESPWAYRYSLYDNGPLKIVSLPKGIQTVVVNNKEFSAIGKHLLIKAGKTSNLRVLTDSAITLKGVTDAVQ